MVQNHPERENKTQAGKSGQMAGGFADNGRRGDGNGLGGEIDGTLPGAALEIAEAAFVNFGNAGERADVFAIAPGRFLQFLEFAREQFQARGNGLVALEQALQPLLDAHGFSLTRRAV
jgi:hypothetical protein